MSNLLQAALDYADKGWYVFPCREKLGTPYEKDGEIITPTEKSPYIAGGLHSASRDAEQIKEWWTVYPNALIGVNTGKSGLFVVDIDRKNVNGFETFSTWEVNDSKGFHSRTPSGGMHIIFTGVGKSSTNVKTGIDTRGDGGYIIVPPSKILEGKVTGDYVKFDDWSGTPGVIPDGLMSKLFPQDTTEYVRGTSSLSFDGKRQLSRASLNFLIEGAPEGERNSTLFKVMADFAGCGYTKEETKEALLPLCERIGLGRSECIEVLNHAYSKPRTASIPDSIQEKILLHGKKVVKSITYAEQAIIEDALIGCMLNDNSNIGVINDILDFDDFQVLKNRWIYKTINYLSATSSGRLDYIIVYDAVSRETDKVSFEDLATIVEKYKNIDTELAISYAEIIKEKSALRKVEALMDNKEQYFESGNLLEVVTAIERDLTNIAIAGGAKSTAVLDSEQAVEMVKVQTELRRKGESGQLEIGFPMFDRYLGGLYPNELVVLAARAGQGKTALALSIANYVAIRKRKTVAFFSLEMSTHEIICRLICQLSGLAYRDVFQGRLTEEEWVKYGEATEQIKNSPLYFDDSFGLTVPEMRSKIRKLMDEGLALVVIDQLEQVRGYDSLAPHLRMDRLAYEIKSLTQEFNVPIILNHQLNRNITDRRFKDAEPQLSDLNQAGEKPANQVWSIVCKTDEEGINYDYAIKMLKNRNGTKLRIPMTFMGERMLFAPVYEGEDMSANNSYTSELPDESYMQEEMSTIDWIPS